MSSTNHMDFKKYEGKRLTTDEVAQVRNEINRRITELEKFKYETGEDYLLLKWGTIKNAQLKSPKGEELLDAYSRLGRCTSVMLQQDNIEQKELIMRIIDECDGVIQNDWCGEYYTKEQAKKYVDEYAKG